jgi:nicotinate phosphoribosyltransferase
MESWVCGENVGLLVDQYELMMLDAFLREGMTATATFSVFVRRLPPHRNCLLACGLEQVLDLLESLRFTPEALERLRAVCPLSADALGYLRGFRFTGDVWAMSEGTPLFELEPLLEVTAPLPQAQVIESLLLNQLHVQTLCASKALRVVTAAQGRDVVEFGLRRAQGADAGLKAARAAWLAGAAATSNVLAGALYGIPVAGTMAHSYVQAHDSELQAFRAWCTQHPASTLLVDTYDSLEGVRKVVQLKQLLGGAFRVRAVRLDSGDLLTLSRSARALLDERGLRGVQIFASGDLDEEHIAQLLRERAPIDGFGVGTAMTVSTDAPSLDLAYKLVEYDGRPRVKLSPHKPALPGRKQVFRRGDATEDVLACFDEILPGEPLLAPVMRNGRRVGPKPSLAVLRDRCFAEVARLPARVRALAPAEPPYPVRISAKLQAQWEQARARASSSPA